MWLEIILFTVLGVVLEIALIIGVIMVFNGLYPYHMRIKELAKNRKIILFDRARDYKDRDGVSWLKLWNEKDEQKRYLPIPPSEAIELNKKGKKCIDLYRIPTGEVLYITDPTEDIYNSKTIQPLTTNQRQMLANNYRKAIERKGKDWTEQLPVIFSMGALVIIVISLFIFWGDLARPLVDARQSDNARMTLENEQLQLLKDIKYGVQTIGAQQIKDSGQPAQPPN